MRQVKSYFTSDTIDVAHVSVCQQTRSAAYRHSDNPMLAVVDNKTDTVQRYIVNTEWLSAFLSENYVSLPGLGYIDQDDVWTTITERIVYLNVFDEAEVFHRIKVKWPQESESVGQSSETVGKSRSLYNKE